MRLTQLSANQQGFKTVKFRPTGATLIVGTQSREGQTYNGVGKSLIVQLIHFCLGSNKNAAFEEKIPQWEFQLAFEIAGASHKVARNTSKQNVVILDDKEVSVTEYRKWLGERAFTLPDDVGLSFRSLIPKFLRRGQKEYNEPLETGEATDYQKILHASFLLGLEVALVKRKCDLRTESTRIDVLKKNFQTDDLLKDFYTGGKDTAIHLAFLDQRIRKLNQDKDQFVLAENYHEMREAADALAERIGDETNRMFLVQGAVDNIDKSLREQPDLPVERVRQLYGELAQTFKPESLRRLQEVSDFHRRMLSNRIARLSGEKLRLLEQVARLQADLSSMRSELDKKIQTLGEARALDHYTALVAQIADLQVQADKLRDYQELSREYTDREAQLQLRLSEEVIATNVYLDETKVERERHLSVFNDYVAKFYPNRIAGISVQNNVGENKIRFDISVHVEGDSSDGINEVRIFCYDLALMTLRLGHKIGFLFHDSRLFANMDIRQRATLFKLAHQVTSTLDTQYIATINPDFISSMEREFTPEEFKRAIGDNVVLELKDDSPAGKLLGLDVDMKYD